MKPRRLVSSYSAWELAVTSKVVNFDSKENSYKSIWTTATENSPLVGEF
jgi:hypothetical protein